MILQTFEDFKKDLEKGQHEFVNQLEEDIIKKDRANRIELKRLGKLPCDFADSLKPGDKLIHKFPKEFNTPDQFIVIEDVCHDFIKQKWVTSKLDYVFNSLLRRFLMDEGYVKVEEFPSVNGKIFNWELSQWE